MSQLSRAFVTASDLEHVVNRVQEQSLRNLVHARQEREKRMKARALKLQQRQDARLALSGSV